MWLKCCYDSFSKHFRAKLFTICFGYFNVFNNIQHTIHNNANYLNKVIYNLFRRNECFTLKMSWN